MRRLPVFAMNVPGICVVLPELYAAALLPAMTRTPNFRRASIASVSKLPAGIVAPVTELFLVLEYTPVPMRTISPLHCKDLRASVTWVGLPILESSVLRMTLLVRFVIDRCILSSSFMMRTPFLYECEYSTETEKVNFILMLQGLSDTGVAGGPATAAFSLVLCRAPRSLKRSGPADELRLLAHLFGCS